MSAALSFPESHDFRTSVCADQPERFLAQRFGQNKRDVRAEGHFLNDLPAGEDLHQNAFSVLAGAHSRVFTNDLGQHRHGVPLLIFVSGKPYNCRRVNSAASKGKYVIGGIA